MAHEGMDFSVALEIAQKLGFAEANPENDIQGTDAAYKLAILATLAFHRQVQPEDIYCEGITRLSSRDFQYAQELGFSIKLLAIAKQGNGSTATRSLWGRVWPTSPAASFQAIPVQGRLPALRSISKPAQLRRSPVPLPACLCWWR